MGLCNIYNYSINKTIKLSDSYKVYIKLSKSDYEKIGMSAPPDGNLMELFECTNVEFPYYKFTEETVSWGNNKEAVYIPDYESMDDLKITLLEHYSSYENYKNKDNENTYNNLLKIGQLVDLFLNKLFDMKTFTYKIDTDFIPELDIYIASNDFNYYIAKYNFTNLKLSDYSSYDLDYSSSSPTKWELSFAFEGYSITYYTDYKDPFESTNAAKPEKPAPAKPKDPAAPVVQPAQPQDAKPSEGAAPAADAAPADAPKRVSKIKPLPPFSATPLPPELQAASETAKKALDCIGGLVPEGTFDEMGSSKGDDPRKSMTGFEGFSVTADNHIDGITSPTPERIEGELKGVEDITGENLMNDMEARAAAKHYEGIAATAEADADTRAAAASVADEWNDEIISKIPNVLGPILPLESDGPVGPVVPDIPPAELAPSFGVNAIVPEGTFGELGERGDPRKNMTGFDDFAITADNHIDGLASPTPQSIATTLKGNAITYETLMDDMESAAVAKHYEGKAIAAEAEEATRYNAASIADEWNDDIISNIPDVLGPLEKPPELEETEEPVTASSSYSFKSYNPNGDGFAQMNEDGSFTTNGKTYKNLDAYVSDANAQYRSDLAAWSRNTSVQKPNAPATAASLRGAEQQGKAGVHTWQDLKTQTEWELNVGKIANDEDMSVSMVASALRLSKIDTKSQWDNLDDTEKLQVIAKARGLQDDFLLNHDESVLAGLDMGWQASFGKIYSQPTRASGHARDCSTTSYEIASFVNDASDGAFDSLGIGGATILAGDTLKSPGSTVNLRSNNGTQAHHTKDIDRIHNQLSGIATFNSTAAGQNVYNITAGSIVVNKTHTMTALAVEGDNVVVYEAAGAGRGFITNVYTKKQLSALGYKVYYNYKTK